MKLETGNFQLVATDRYTLIKLFPMLNGTLLQYLCLILLLVLSGCSSLPVGLPLAQEEYDISLGQFKKMIADQAQCPSSLDADVSISFRKVVNAGTISGYLQGKAPSFLRFEGVNPLGMTEIIAGTDGEGFQLINVRQKKIYTGKTSAEKIQRYAGGEFSLQTSYYWLIGRVPPGPLSISDLRRDPEGNGYWADIVYENWQTRSMVLFSSSEGVVLQNIVSGKKGDVLARFVYEYDTAAIDTDASFQGEGYQCRYPRSIIIDENANGIISIQFKKTYFNVEFEPSDFDMVIPKGFERKVIR